MTSSWLNLNFTQANMQKKSTQRYHIKKYKVIISAGPLVYIEKSRLEISLQIAYGVTPGTVETEHVFNKMLMIPGSLPVNKCIFDEYNFFIR